MSNCCIILVIIGIIGVICSDISNLGGYIGIFSGNNAIFHRDNTDLSQNVVLLGICNIAQIVYIAQYIQLLTMYTITLLCIVLIQLSQCILAIELALYVHMLCHIENKPIQKTRGGINECFQEYS